MAPFYGCGSTASRLEPLRGGCLLFSRSPRKFLILTLLTSEGWKAESTWRHPVVLNMGPLDWESSTIMKDYDIQSYQSMASNRFRTPRFRTPRFCSALKITIMWVKLKKIIYNLLWLTEFHCRGVIKFNLSNLFFWGQFRRSWKWSN